MDLREAVAEELEGTGVAEEDVWELCVASSEDPWTLYPKVSFEKVGEAKSFGRIGGLGWDGPANEEFAKREEREVLAQAIGLRVREGEIRCPNLGCGSKECVFYQEQTRSADEGATTKVLCGKCGRRFVLN